VSQARPHARPDAGSSARFVYRVRTGAFRAHPLGEGESLIGRDRGLWLSLPLEGVSRRHARVVPRAGEWWLEDLGSTNGTFVNGQRVEREPLRHLDVVSLGRRVDLVFVLPGDARPAASRIARATLTRLRDGAGVDLEPGETMLGRAAECALPAADPGVADFHARLERSATALVVEDLGPGTRVNGQPVAIFALADGDEVSLAGGESYRVGIEAEFEEPSPSERRPLDRSDPNATLYEWGPEERQAIAELRRALGRTR
jgi:pSer/pThr/pTyr-binding forkhead associated (FHA) protein